MFDVTFENKASQVSAEADGLCSDISVGVGFPGGCIDVHIGTVYTGLN